MLKIAKHSPQSNGLFSVEEITAIYWLFIFTTSHSEITFSQVDFSMKHLIPKIFFKQEKQIIKCTKLFHDLCFIYKVIHDKTFNKKQEQIQSILFDAPSGIKLFMLSDICFNSPAIRKELLNKLKNIPQKFVETFKNQKVISENNFTPRSEEFLAVLSPRYLDTARSSRTNRSEPVFKNSRSTLEIYNSHVEINKSFYCENKRFSISEMSTASGNKQSKKAVKKKNKAKKDKKLKSKIGLSQISNIDTIHETVKEQESSDKDDNKSVKSTPLRSSNRKKQPQNNLVPVLDLSKALKKLNTFQAFSHSDSESESESDSASESEEQNLNEEKEELKIDVSAFMVNQETTQKPAPLAIDFFDLEINTNEIEKVMSVISDDQVQVVEEKKPDLMQEFLNLENSTILSVGSIITEKIEDSEEIQKEKNQVCDDGFKKKDCESKLVITKPFLSHREHNRTKIIHKINQNNLIKITNKLTKNQKQRIKLRQMKAIQKYISNQSKGRQLSKQKLEQSFKTLQNISSSIIDTKRMQHNDNACVEMGKLAMEGFSTVMNFFKVLSN